MWLNSVTLAQNYACKFDGCSGAEIRGEDAHFLPGCSRKQQYASDATAAGYSNTRDDLQLLTRDFGYRNKAYPHSPFLNVPRASGRNGKRKIDLFPLRAVEHAPNEWDGVQITDRADVRLRTLLVQIPVYRRVFKGDRG
jgi:hypothetical protein